MEKRIILVMACLVLFVFRTFAEEGNQEDQFLNVQVKEIHFFITPSFRFVLPDTSIKIGMKQDIGKTVLEGQTEYNYLYSRMNYLLKYSLDVFMKLEVSLYDNISFEQIYQQNKYLQRNRGLSGAVITPAIFDICTITQRIRNETAYMANLNEDFDIEEGNLLLWNTGIRFDFPWVDLNFNIQKAFPHEISKYNYLVMDVSACAGFKINNRNKISYALEYGNVLERLDIPLWKIRTMGGYHRMMGYSVDEIQGYYKMYGKIRYDFLAFEEINKEFFVLKLIDINTFCIVEAGHAGSAEELTAVNNYKFSAAAGIRLRIRYRDRLNMDLAFVLARAFEKDYNPAFYFIQEI